MSRVERVVAAAALMLAAAAIIVGATTGNAALAGALAVLAPVSVIAYQSVQTRRAVDAAHADVVASRQLALEAQRDRELAIQPFVAPGTGARVHYGGPMAASGQGFVLQVRNIGRGPAIQLRILYRQSRSVHWNHEPVLLGAGESVPPPNALTPDSLLLDGQRDASGVRDYIVSSTTPHDLVAYCLDQLGNWLRFNLRTGEPPKIWREDREPPPEWAGFRDYQ